MITAYLQMAMALAAVVGLIVLIGFFLKKRQTTGGMMKVLAYQSLGQRKGLVAVKVGEEVLLLSVTSSDLRLLRTYDSGEIKAEPPKETGGGKLNKLRHIKETLHEHQ
jgi:flagellar biogenesis protein FliO